VPVRRDIVSCGSGFDRVLADRQDLVAPDCEKVRVVHGSRAEVLEQEEAFFATPAVSGFFEGFFEGLAPDPTAGG
jgi:hypothetical protein